ncbi:MAG: hypothetical protein PHG39_07880 [Acidithiobacillus ferrooxidans]|nr:hypothetical protein [Acidithiobacillus ferrooxidans]MDD5378873.1 hypothetical protein [Acidithiobacillus sp.]MDD5575448.1 hypothetical protein [Acidithiobacillus sp.]
MSVGFTRAPKNISENTVEEFISKADIYNVSKDALPWIGLRDDKRTELYNIRFTEVEMSKLRFIAEHTPNSMQTFLIKHILPAIDRAVDDVLLDIKRKKDSTDRSI